LLPLDTNHCFSIIADHPLFLDRLRHVGWEGILTSVVVAGELYYGASISEQADLWIAATAIDRGAMLVSADSDFTRMREAIDLVITDWTRS